MKKRSNSGSAESSDSDNSDTVPERPELKGVNLQKIVLLSPCSLFPKHPRTIFFSNDPNLNETHVPSGCKLEKYEIRDKRYMVVYKAYKNLPLCLSEPMKFNNIIRTKLFEDTNIIWKLMKQDKMFPLLNELNPYQRFNHFPMTWQLSRKDNLYNNFMKMKQKFPQDYNYMPETYILPKDLEILKDLQIFRNQDYFVMFYGLIRLQLVKILMKMKEGLVILLMKMH